MTASGTMAFSSTTPPRSASHPTVQSCGRRKQIPLIVPESNQSELMAFRPQLLEPWRLFRVRLCPRGALDAGEPEVRAEYLVVDALGRDT